MEYNAEKLEWSRSLVKVGFWGEVRLYRLKIRPRFFGNEKIYYIEQRIKQVLDEGGRAICVFDADVTNWDAAEKKIRQ